ncbi:MAG: hypothetical protein KIT62_06305 [Cyclobacteriaceae bacterium]|nr:hypothetical protein [Cyclobacteriaceae bacterium]
MFLRLTIQSKREGMINVAFIRPDFGNTKVAGSYLKNFNLALVNWELNRKEDQQKGRKNRKGIK